MRGAQGRPTAGQTGPARTWLPWVGQASHPVSPHPLLPAPAELALPGEAPEPPPAGWVLTLAARDSGMCLGVWRTRRICPLQTPDAAGHMPAFSGHSHHTGKQSPVALLWLVGPRHFLDGTSSDSSPYRAKPASQVELPDCQVTGLVLPVTLLLAPSWGFPRGPGSPALSSIGSLVPQIPARTRPLCCGASPASAFVAEQPCRPALLTHSGI